jgi:hypothetical protein
MKTELEEAAERYTEEHKWEEQDPWLDFIEGAMWQQEKMYSEEEVEMIARDAYEMGRKNILIGVFNKWFKQFKKK